MSTDSPELVPITLVDLTEQDLVDIALTDAAVKLPEWEPREGNTEVVLLEAQALITAELVYALNLLPDSVLEAVIGLYGLERDLGAPPAASFQFATSAATETVVPAGTRVRITYNTDDALDFLTNTDLLIPAGGTATVTATAEENTDELNGSPTGITVELVDAILAVDTVTLTGNITGGRLLEESPAYRQRGANLFARLTSSLVLPSHFTAAALEFAGVARATTVDKYNPTAVLPTPGPVTATPSTTGGTLAAGTYSYRVSATNADGETLASAAVTAATTGTTGSVALSWPAVTAPTGTDPVTGYKVYGRVGGAEGLLATVTGTSYTDTGAAAVGAPPPTANTTGGDPGDHLGHVTVAVGATGGGAVAPDTVTDLLADLTSKAHAGLTVHAIAPTITAVDVTASVTILPGYVAATVIDAIEAALTDYLNPDTWAWSGTVYRNELIALIDRVAGVDRVVNITTPAGDVTLAGVAPLADAGVLTITTV